MHPINLRGDDDGVNGGLQILGSDKGWNGNRLWWRARCAAGRKLVDHTLIEIAIEDWKVKKSMAETKAACCETTDEVIRRFVGGGSKRKGSRTREFSRSGVQHGSRERLQRFRMRYYDIKLVRPAFCCAPALSNNLRNHITSG